MVERTDQERCAPHIRPWRSRSVLGIGEAMVEFAPMVGDTYRRGFAGDTLNTCWHMAQILGTHARVGYFTKVGVDSFSDELLAFIEASQIDAQRIVRDPDRQLGLYVISLTGAERHFTYWRELSAARRLADDPTCVAEATRDCGLIHVSGITLAVIGEAGRRHLFEALAAARGAGAVVSFDPNVRLRLWHDVSQLRAATQAMLEVTDIALPSFDDEVLVWGDSDPDATLTRLERAGVAEIVVKNGASDAVYAVAGHRGRSPTPTVAVIRDTTGAGDSFNSGYLAARLVGLEPLASCGFGQRVAAQVIAHHGALAPREALSAVRDALHGHATGRGLE
jgi:2-dehydro-3-deoxygluconokinase